MHVRALERWLKARPFGPFVMHLSSGEKVEVRHPETAFAGKNAILVVKKRGIRLLGFAHISLFHVVKIEAANGANNGRGKRMKRL